MKKSRMNWFFVLVISLLLIQSIIQPLKSSSSPIQQRETIRFIIWELPTDTDILDKMIADYNKNHTTTVTISYQWYQWQEYYVKSLLRQKDPSIDIMTLDVIRVAEYAFNDWLAPLTDIENTLDLADFFPATVEAAKYSNVLYTLPWFHHSGMLYYRKDVLKFAYDNGIISENRAPVSWAEFHNWTRTMLNNTFLVDYFNTNYGQDLKGFVWQAKEYEGLMCDLMEWIGAAGEESFLNSDNNAAKFSSSGVVNALTYMRSLITDGISPEAVLTYEEEESRMVWDEGNAIFSRNWPYQYRLSLNNTFLNGSQDSYLGTNESVFGVSPLPTINDSKDYPVSCLGGWHLAINAFSEHQEEAKKFIKWLVEEDQQVTFSLGYEDFYPTRSSAYDNAAIQKSDRSYILEFLPIFERSIARPLHPNYENISREAQPLIHAMISGKKPILEGVMELDEVLKPVINIKNPGIDLSFLYHPFSIIIYAGLIILAVLVIYLRRKGAFK